MLETFFEFTSQLPHLYQGDKGGNIMIGSTQQDGADNREHHDTTESHRDTTHDGTRETEKDHSGGHEHEHGHHGDTKGHTPTHDTGEHSSEHEGGGLHQA